MEQQSIRHARESCSIDDRGNRLLFVLQSIMRGAGWEFLFWEQFLTSTNGRRSDGLKGRLPSWTLRRGSTL